MVTKAARAKTAQSKTASMQKKQEQQLADELQLISLLKENPDIFQRHPALLAEMDVTHESGAAISLIERQVNVLRERNQTLDTRLCELMDVARDNERLAQSRHRIAINLLGAHDLMDVVSIVLDELSNELKADYAVIRLFSDDADRLEQDPLLFISPSATGINAFKTMREHKNPVCGSSSKEQKQFLFAKEAEKIKSAAIIPLSAGADLGLIGLGSKEAGRFQPTMGTQFLAQMGELVSAALAVHLEVHQQSGKSD